LIDKVGILRNLIYKPVGRLLIALLTHCFYWAKYSPTIELE